MTVSTALHSAGRRRSPATLPGFHAGRPPRNKGMLYPAGPPTVEQIVGVMRHAHDHPHGWRLRAMIVMLRRGGLRVQEALASSTHGTSKAGSGGAPHEAQDLPPGQRRPVAR